MDEKKIWIVKGFKIISYKRKSDGKEVSGVEVYLQKIETDESVTGLQFISVYLNDKYSYYSPCLEDRVKLIYNQFARVEDLQLV